MYLVVELIFGPAKDLVCFLDLRTYVFINSENIIIKKSFICYFLSSFLLELKLFVPSQSIFLTLSFSVTLPTPLHFVVIF